MRIPISWLSDYVDIKGVSDVQLSDSLTLSGTENEILKVADFPGIVVGEILEIQKHNNADKLRVTKTNVGTKNGGKLQIVCGAPNIEVGQKVPVALVGADMGEFQIKEAEIRGVKSFGMLCSESELGISDNHDGIMILDPRAKIGQPLGEVLNISGTVIEAELTPNRSDCFSMIGVAREASATLNRKMKNLNFDKVEVKSTKKVKIEVREEILCPRYAAKVVEGVEIGPSPNWIQERLSAAGIRPINNVVDVTNYVMLEWGQPLHAFDMKKIQTKNDNCQIVVRKAKKGETLETLDGAKRLLTEKDLIIADSKKAIALAGVMGGANSEVDKKTTTIVLEAAVFDGVSVRKTAQRLGLRTEASNRCEKGVPLQLPEIAIERAAQLLTEIPGGLAGKKPILKPKAGEICDVFSANPWTNYLGVTEAQVSKFFGVDIDASKIISILTSLGFQANKFDFKNEARKHVGKPYVFGASYKTHGEMAFDCSYLTDYLYRLTGNFIGHTSLAQFMLGTPVNDEDLRPGDILFVRGHIEKSATDHYYVPDGKGGHEKVILSKPREVGHNGIYIGGGRVVHARSYEYDQKLNRWKKANKAEVVEESANVFLNNPEYLGARRYLEDTNGIIATQSPWWRLDVKIKEDILEEVGRIYGYNNLPSVLPSGNLPDFEENKLLKLSREIKQSLFGIGFSEVYNYSFTSAKVVTAFGVDLSQCLRLKNPISPDLEYMRMSLSGSLLKNINLNQDGSKNISIFEIASTYKPRKDILPEENINLCLAVRSASKKAGQSFFDIKGALETILRAQNITDFSYNNIKDSFMDKSLELVVSGERVGYLGLISNKTKDYFGLKSEVAVAEIPLGKLEKLAGRVRKFQTIPRFPTASRDINVVFDNSVIISTIEECLKRIKNPLLQSAVVQDIYEGKGLPEGKKSVTISLVFGSLERTLLDSEIEAGLKGIIVEMDKIGGELRA